MGARGALLKHPWEESILIRGARVHNLKNVSLAIPHNVLTVYTEQMNQAVFAFRRYEDASLRYSSIEPPGAYTLRALRHRSNNGVKAAVGEAITNFRPFFPPSLATNHPDPSVSRLPARVIPVHEVHNGNRSPSSTK